ncbi:MAG TPA: hypothetical protein VFX67_10125 [Burkholderiales bacterium]|nr:hypothetical protein [Burkholderiales bacterium]
MTQHDEAQGAQHALAVRPEKLLPLKRADHRFERGIAAPHNRTAFVKEREHVAYTAAPSAFARNLGRMQRVDCSFGARKRKPGERVEQVVPVFRAGGDAPGAMDLHFVVRIGARGLDEADRLSGGGAHLRFLGERVQCCARRPAGARQARQPRSNRIENRMSC